jgi:predicted nicotinamide N-methyase
MASIDPGSSPSSRGKARGSQDGVRRRALQQRISRHYTTVTQQVAIGDLRLLFTRIADPDDMTRHMPDPRGSPDTPQWQPYWAAHWDGSWAVSHILANEPLGGRTMLDLGCGLGLTGAVAAAGGARVWMVDAAQPALLFARLNTWPWRDRVHVRRLDWRTDRLTPYRFDLIVGADIIYDTDDWPYLERFWRQHLCGGGQLLLGESGRRTGQMFPDWLSDRGWLVESTTIPIAQCDRPQRIIRARCLD